MPLLPGELLNGRYRITSLLAQGTYGCTYQAYDIRAERRVAVKEVLDASVETQKAFRAGARRLSDLHHEQLTAVLDHFALEDIGQYLVSEYVAGVDLGQLLKQYGPLPSDLIIGWLQAVCAPLTYLHEHDILHLNLKPANIRLTPTGDIKLVGVQVPELGLMGGNGRLSPPEQQNQATLSPTADIYSLGATLYMLLTGEEPPNALSRESGLSDLIPAREVNPNVEPYLSLVANRAMSLRADARYDTATDFRQALERPSGYPATESSKLRRTPDADMPAPTPRPVVRRSRRQIEAKTVLGLIGLILVFTIMIGTVIILNLENEDNPPVTEAEATSTVESAVIAALTQIAPTPTPLPRPTDLPTPTPEPIITDLGNRMLFVPSGLSVMGIDDGERDEQPARPIELDSYFIDETEVTVAQYAECVAAGECRQPLAIGENYYGDPNFDDYPVIFVNWYDADTFCEWRGARLPSEAEWEKAATFDPATKSKFVYPWGDLFDGTNLNFCDVNCTSANRDVNVDDGYRFSAPVGTYGNGRSPIGAYDMAGNVMEWVSDWYAFRYYSEGSDTNPMGPPEGEFKSFRGGSWLSTAEEVVSTARANFDPLVNQANLGFRCAMTAP
ncbi:MAG: SUMF1/EgtB/PvdO family nonheme iron enzyme [Anaerolineae bacterium]|nr:SUMF1/EgtB/PvdO family nonheme iron enzyme [Anaerolineae bacterium]